jgi:hypothetical protein
MKTISINQLQAILFALNHAAPITISTFTDARLLKTGNPYANVHKLSKVNGFTGFDYQNAVNRQLERENSQPDFESQARKWGTKISDCLIENKGKYYLIIRPLRCRKPIYFKQTEFGWLMVATDKIKQFIPIKKQSNQGTEKEIVYRNYLLTNIKYIAIGGEQYKIKQ